MYVSDFGIARMVDAATSTLMGAGTPAYMSPEQIKGKDPTPQMDVYSLGVVLYEMLTGGERPFVGDAAQTTGTTAEKVIWEKTHLEAPSPRRYRADITPEMETVVLRCLQRKAEARYSSVLDLLNDLERATLPREMVEPEVGKIRAAAKAPAQPVLTPAEQLGTLPVDEEDVAVQPKAKISPEQFLKTQKWLNKTKLIVIILIITTLGAVVFAIWQVSPSVESQTPSLSLLSTSSMTHQITNTSPPSPTIQPTLTSTATKARPSASPTPTITNVPISAMLYTQDFEEENVKDWNVYYGNFVIKEENGNHYWRGTGVNDYPQAWLERTALTEKWMDYTFESRIRIIEGVVYICVRSLDGGSSFYNAYISPQDDAFAFADLVSGKYQVFDGRGFSTNFNQWYTMRFEIRGEQLRFYVNEKLVASSTRSSHDRGGIGYFIRGGNIVDIDDIQVWKLP